MELNLRINNIEDAGIEIENNIGRNLVKLTSLVLDLGNNNIIGEGFGNGLVNLNKLVYLSL